MNEVKWIIVLNKRVTPVNADGTCNIGGITCAFELQSCQVPNNKTKSGNSSACVHHASDQHMFITEDQLPDYLVERLVANT